MIGPKNTLKKLCAKPYIRVMRDTGITFGDYLTLAFEYAFMEYDFEKGGFFMMTPEMMEHVGTCWMTCVAIPDVANYIATHLKENVI